MHELLAPTSDAVPHQAIEIPGQARLFELGETDLPHARGLRAHRSIEHPQRAAWLLAAQGAIRFLATGQSVLTVLDLRRELESRYPRPWPIDERGLGIVLDAARRASMIEHSGAWVEAAGKPVTVWRSLLW